MINSHPIPCTEVTTRAETLTQVKMNSDFFIFKSNSKLKEFMVSRSENKKEEFTLKEIFYTLKETIKKEELYDPTNPEIFFCSPELEACLGMLVLHISQVKEVVMEQLIPTGRGKDKRNMKSTPVTSREQITPRISGHVGDLQSVKRHKINKEARYEISEPLLKVLRMVPGFNQEGSIFTFGFITETLSKYILMNKHRFFDTRNISLAIVRNDPLGEAFGLQGFHRSQVIDLLLKQLKPIDHAIGDVITITASITSTSEAQNELGRSEDEANTAKDLDDTWVIINVQKITLDDEINEPNLHQD